MGSEASRALTITVEQGSLLDVDTQVIVNAANSHGLMGGGVAGIIRRVAGFQVEEEARKQAPHSCGNGCAHLRWANEIPRYHSCPDHAGTSHADPSMQCGGCHSGGVSFG